MHQVNWSRYLYWCISECAYRVCMTFANVYFSWFCGVCDPSKSLNRIYSQMWHVYNIMNRNKTKAATGDKQRQLQTNYSNHYDWQFSTIETEGRQKMKKKSDDFIYRWLRNSTDGRTYYCRFQKKYQCRQTQALREQTSQQADKKISFGHENVTGLK